MSAVLSVLLVDGDYDHCDLVSRFLSERGYDVHVAYDSSTALELLETHPFRLVLLHHWPPFLDALALCRRISRRKPGLPVLVTGSEEALPYRSSAGALEPVAYSPPGLDQLGSAVDELLLQNPAPTAA